jgi:hypothetical protein
MRHQAPLRAPRASSRGCRGAPSGVDRVPDSGRDAGRTSSDESSPGGFARSPKTRLPTAEATVHTSLTGRLTPSGTLTVTARVDRCLCELPSPWRVSLAEARLRRAGERPSRACLPCPSGRGARGGEAAAPRAQGRRAESTGCPTPDAGTGNRGERPPPIGHGAALGEAHVGVTSHPNRGRVAGPMGPAALPRPDASEVG